MTFARWRQDGFGADFVARELAKGGIKPQPQGGLQYSGTAFFGEPLALLETGVEFLVPISDLDRSRIITRALEEALRSKDYGPSALIREVNKATRDFARLPETKYIVATGLSFEHFEDLTRVGSSGCRLYVRRQFPRHLARTPEEAKRRSRKDIRGDYPENASFKGYASVWVHVRGRSASEAMQRALEFLDLRRGIWNFALNRGLGATHPAPVRGPLNKVLAGPVYSLHLPDGTLATEYDWFEPHYMGPEPSRKLQERWDQVRADEEGIHRILSRSPYSSTLKDALRRYCRALDSADLSSTFLNLWSLLETLTGTGRRDGHDKVVKRASFIYADSQRKTHEQVLHHLRRYRNSYIHAGEGSNQAGAYLHQLRLYVEQLLLFHLQNSRNLGSLDRLVRFLDLPAEAGEIEHQITTEEQKAETAKEAAHLAKEGLRFRRGRPPT